MSDNLTEHSIKQRLYVIPCAPPLGGYTCIGFDVAEDRRRAVLMWVKNGCDVPPREVGTQEHYDAYRAAMKRGEAHAAKTGTRCEVELLPQLIGLEGHRVEVVDRDGERRRFNVGKSTGWMPCHLEVKTRRSLGGAPADSRGYQRVNDLGKAR